MKLWALSKIRYFDCRAAFIYVVIFFSCCYYELYCFNQDGVLIMSLINKEVEDFTVQAYVNGEFRSISKKDIMGKWTVFFFFRFRFAQQVPQIGIEPIRCCHHWILSPARLPVPPLRQSRFFNAIRIISEKYWFFKENRANIVVSFFIHLCILSALFLLIMCNRIQEKWQFRLKQ